MRSAAVFIAFVLCSTVAHVSSTIILTGTTLTAATVSTSALGAVAAAGGLGALAVAKGVVLAGLLRGRRRYYKRSISTQEEEETTAVMLEVAQKMDSAGCVAKLLCELEAVPVEQLSPAALTLKSAFSGDSKLKTGAYAVAYNFGSKLAKNNPKACDLIYTDCPLPKSELFNMLETTFTC